jgi:outer membrane usher protein FimD/PapC
LKRVVLIDAACRLLAAVEQVYVSRGSRVQAGIINEDGTLYLRNMTEGQTVTIPQGLL